VITGGPGDAAPLTIKRSVSGDQEQEQPGRSTTRLRPPPEAAPPTPGTRTCGHKQWPIQRRKSPGGRQPVGRGELHLPNCGPNAQAALEGRCYRLTVAASGLKDCSPNPAGDGLAILGGSTPRDLERPEIRLPCGINEHFVINTDRLISSSTARRHSQFRRAASHHSRRLGARRCGRGAGASTRCARRS
jgi:hypothetical protein